MSVHSSVVFVILSIFVLCILNQIQFRIFILTIITSTTFIIKSMTVFISNAVFYKKKKKEHLTLMLRPNFCWLKFASCIFLCSVTIGALCFISVFFNFCLGN